MATEGSEMRWQWAGGSGSRVASTDACVIIQ